jgi:hypothetical protein
MKRPLARRNKITITRFNMAQKSARSGNFEE